MLLDSARIQESDAQWKAKKNKRSGDPTEDALYTVQDATDTLELLVPVSYGDHVELFPGIAADWYDAGHLLGSAAIRFTVTEGPRPVPSSSPGISAMWISLLSGTRSRCPRPTMW